MKASLLIAALLIHAVVSQNTRWYELDTYNFEKYVVEYQKSYEDAAEYSMRKALFHARMKEVAAHNADGSHSYKKGINHLSDLTEQELKNMRGYKRTRSSAELKAKHSTQFVATPMSSVPTSVDWREKNVVTPVKNQGGCGSCWTFGTAETIESHHAIKTGQLVEMSEQQILDCTPNPKNCGGTGGCGGGTPEIAYAAIIEQGGLASEWTYPYISFSLQSQKCINQTNLRHAASISSFVQLPANQLDPVINALVNNGPLAINVDAGAWSGYESGVFDGCSKTEIGIDHVVQLVGYGTDAKLGDYWIVRNSWDTRWGENGYIRIKRTSDVQCGQDHSPSQGTGCDGGPSVVTVCGPCGLLYDVSYPTMK